MSIEKEREVKHKKHKHKKHKKTAEERARKEKKRKKERRSRSDSSPSPKKVSINRSESAQRSVSRPRRSVSPQSPSPPKRSASPHRRSVSARRRDSLSKTKRSRSRGRQSRSRGRQSRSTSRKRYRANRYEGRRDRRGGRDVRDRDVRDRQSRQRDPRDSWRDRRIRDRRDRSKERRIKKAEEEKPPEERKLTPQEIAAQKARDEAYQKRVAEQMKQLEMRTEDSEEEGEVKVRDTAEERRKRRMALLAHYARQAQTKVEEASEQTDVHENGANGAQESDTMANGEDVEMVDSNDSDKASKPLTSAEYSETAEEDDRDKVKTANKELARNNEVARKKAFDMFNDDASKLVVSKDRIGVAGGGADTCDDHEGYYKFRNGDLLGDRYLVCKQQGRGVFSTVLRVRDTKVDNRELVVKIIRRNDTMLNAGLKELQFLKLIAKNDPENKRHCVRLFDHFEHRGHLCMIFEPLAMNLREVLKKVGGGLSVEAVKSYSKQLFTALRHLKKCGILHGDIKLDNILVNKSLNICKLCDFGSAGQINKCELTPYLVSRFYRPPEIVIGVPYDEGADMWSIGTVLYELFTGKILFAGSNNNEMLRQIMEISGGFSKKFLKRAKFTKKHFDDDYRFKMQKVDPLTKQILLKAVVIDKPTKRLQDMLLDFCSPSVTDAEKRKIYKMADLLTKIFTLEPARRITVEQALHHPFIRDD